MRHREPTWAEHHDLKMTELKGDSAARRARDGWSLPSSPSGYSTRVMPLLPTCGTCASVQLVTSECRHDARDLFSYFVANRSHLFESLLFWIIEMPIQPAHLRRRRGARFAATHRHQKRRIVCEAFGEKLRLCLREIDPDFKHRVDHNRMHTLCGLGARGHRPRFIGICHHVEPARRHLRTTRTVHTREDHLLHAACLAGITHRLKRMAAPIATNCAAIKPGTSEGRIPAKVSLKARASVTAGFAKEVEEVNQYAAVM